MPDITDACPDKPGAPHPNPKKNGCPGDIIIKGSQIVIMSPVFFATDRDVILPKSFKILTAVANAIIGQPAIKKVIIEGHTDNTGTREHNLDLSDRRARSVRRWLIANGIDPRQLDVVGYGPDRPVAENTTKKGKADNRRVEFHIIDPGAPVQGGSTEQQMTPIPGMPPLIRQPSPMQQQRQF